MVKINPLNVIKLLYDDFKSFTNKTTKVITSEIELKDRIKGKFAHQIISLLHYYLLF